MTPAASLSCFPSHSDKHLVYTADLGQQETFYTIVEVEVVLSIAATELYFYVGLNWEQLWSVHIVTRVVMVFIETTSHDSSD